MNKLSQYNLQLTPISSAAPETLYRQVAESIKSEIAAGRFAGGVALPSFRVLAEELLVSVITVKRAYEELEREGIVFRKQGLGTFVTDVGDEAARESRRLHAADCLRKGVRECIDSGVSPANVVQLVRGYLAHGEDF